jgi:glycosyltransferase involved in cell wall biosynthesis
MISIVTGTLNRVGMLPTLIANTVLSDDRLELVLVDGGSTDGTQNYIKTLNHPRIKLIEVGNRSSYPHFMNLGIQAATHEIICQWNDDVILCNEWKEVFLEIQSGHDFYLFNWKYGTYTDKENPDWLKGVDHTDGWCLCNVVDSGGEIVMNYGLYRKKIFREIGMYNPEYQYYCADGDMSYRAYQFGYRVKDLRHIRVCSLPTNKVATPHPEDHQIYQRNMELYRNKTLPQSLQYL